MASRSKPSLLWQDHPPLQSDCTPLS
jgi:hypothetical protein